MVVALDNNSSLTRYVSLNSSIACSFSKLSSEVSSISNACLSIVSNAQRHTWQVLCDIFLNGLFSMISQVRNVRSDLALDICNSYAISPWLKPLDLISTTLDLLHSNWSDFVPKVQVFAS